MCNIEICYVQERIIMCKIEITTCNLEIYYVKHRINMSKIEINYVQDRNLLCATKKFAMLIIELLCAT